MNAIGSGDSTLLQVASLRARLWDSGFRPVPVYNHDADHPSPGKAPMGVGWRKAAQADPPAAVTEVPNLRAINTGILADGLRVIDIDVDNPTLAHSVRQQALDRFGETVMRYRANSPRTLLLYRAAEGAPDKRVVVGTLGKVEILGAGQQFVAFGTHDTGATLQWMPEAPGEISADSLPPITEAQVTEFLRTAAETIGVKPPAPIGTTSPLTSPAGLMGDIQRVLVALFATPNAGPANWEAWNRKAMALWSATNGSEAGRAALHAWSQQHPSYDSVETNARWDHYRVSPPTSLGAGTIFYEARQARQSESYPEMSADDPGWSPEVESEPAPHEHAPLPPGLPLTDPTRLQHIPIPEREWVVQDWLPVGHVTLAYGDGGVGKTLLAQQLMTACATGSPWCGLRVEPCRVLGLFCEDDGDEIHRRQDAINRGTLRDRQPLEFSDLADMRWISRVGADNLLVTFDRDSRAELTSLFLTLEAEAIAFCAKLVVIDTAADTFGGNENDRSEVRQYIGYALTRLAQRIGGAVLLNAHPSRSGMSTTGDLDGGSTGWSNSARSRWSLTRPTGEDVPADTPERVLTRRKANYASKGAEIQLRWQAGILAPVRPSTGGFDAMGREAEADTLFLQLLARAVAKGTPVSANNRAGNFAPKDFSKSSDAKGFRWKELERAMRVVSPGVV